jgi:hypothetical protein
MVTIFDVGERMNPNLLVKDLPSKSHFLDFDENEVDNVKKGGQRVSKHAGFWVRNAFVEWRIFHGLDTTRSIV